MKFIQSNSHQEAFPEQYNHKMCGKKVRVMRQGEPGASGNAPTQSISGIVLRVVPSRFGELALISGAGKDYYLVSDLVVLR